MKHFLARVGHWVNANLPPSRLVQGLLLAALIAAIAKFGQDFYKYVDPRDSEYAFLFVLVPVILIVLFWLISYLNPESSKDTREKPADRIAGVIAQFAAEQIRLRNMIKDMQASPTSVGHSRLTEEDREQLSTRMSAEFRSELNESFKEGVKADLRESFERTSQIDAVDAAGLRITTRLTREIDNLGRRATVNLSIGIAFGLLGFAVLGASLWFFVASPDEAWQQTITRAVPRVALALAIEFFGYYFLRMYRHDTGEIKHFQNEMTNVEFWTLAYSQAVRLQDKTAIKDLGKKLMVVERNFILKKGETTVSRQSEPPDTEAIAVIDLIKAAVSKAKSTNTNSNKS